MADQICKIMLSGKLLSTLEPFTLVNFNDDYYIQVAGDALPTAAEGWMISGGKVYKHLLDENGRVQVPGAFLSDHQLLFGVSWDGFSTVPVRIYVVESIKGVAAKFGALPYEVPDESEVAQLIALVNRIEAEIASGIDVDALTEDQIAALREKLGSGLPPVTAVDNRKIIQVKDGAWNVQHPELGEETLHFLTNMEIEALLSDE